MASISYSTLRLGGASASASDYLGSSSNGVSGIPLRTLGRAKFTTRRRDLAVTARIKKVKKFDGPWPKDPNPDPNVQGGILSYLSKFKPLAVPPKPVRLGFEKPLIDLEKELAELRKKEPNGGGDFTEKLNKVEDEYNKKLKEIYMHLTPIQRVNIARHPNRPTFLDHMRNITDKFVELHGDRAGYDDPAIVTGIGSIDGKPYMFIGHQKGRNSKENIKRNFGMPTPHGYRKALRMMYYAEHHGFPIVTFIDTPGAYADLQCEHKGQGEAIAHNLRTMFGLKVPILSIVIGEGGSGGALAIGCANKMLMLENAVFFVASPEACAAILYKSSTAAPKAAEKLKITSTELVKLQIADGIIPEPLGGAHADPLWTSQQIKIAIKNNMTELEKMSGEELLKHRMAKYRKIGNVKGGSKKIVNMKKIILKLEGEVEELKELILKAKEKPLEEDGPLSEVIDKVIEKLKSAVHKEYIEAARAVGLKERPMAVSEESLKASSEDHLMHPVLREKIEKLNARLSDAPNYESLKSMMKMLRDLFRAKAESEAASLRNEINKRFQEVMDRPEITEKVEAVKAEVASSGASSFDELSDELKEKVLKTTGEVKEEMKGVLKSMGLELEAVERNLKETFVTKENLQEKLEKVNEEISVIIEKALRTPRIKSIVESLKVKTAKASQKPRRKIKMIKKLQPIKLGFKQIIFEILSKTELPKEKEELQKEIEKLEQQNKQKLEQQKILKALSMSVLQEKEEELEKEIAAACEVAAEESNGSLKEDEESGKPEIVNSKFA